MSKKKIIFVIFILTFVTLTSILHYSNNNINNVERIDDDPNIVIFMIESLRSDHLQCHGYHRNITPNICSLIEEQEAVSFKNAYSQASYTKLSVPSFFTSLPPSSVVTDGWDHRIDGDSETIVDTLLDHNYTTTGDHIFEMPCISDRCHSGYRHIPGDGVETVNEILEDGFPDDPFFLFTFFRNRAHTPYSPPEEYRKWDDVNYSSEELANMSSEEQHSLFSVQEMKDLYHGEAREVDNKISEVIKKMEREGIYDETLIIITSDHGKFGKSPHFDFVMHGGSPKEGLINVPLIFKLPNSDRGGQFFEENVRLIDVIPTIYDYLELESTPYTYGESLIPIINEDGESLPVFSASYPVNFNDLEDNVWTLTENEYKYYLYGMDDTCKMGTEPDRELMFNLEEDPGETENIIDEVNDNKIEDYRDKICDIYLEGLSRRHEMQDVELSEDEIESLERLGYL